MEILGYLLAFAGSKFAAPMMKKLTAGAGESVGRMIDDALDSLAGGSIEEILESVVEKVFGGCGPYFKRRRKDQKFLARLVGLLQKLSAEELRELNDFLTARMASEQSRGKTPRFAEQLQALEGSERERKQALREIKHELSDLSKAISELQEAELANLDDRVMTRRLFALSEEEAIPASVLSLVSLFNDYLLEARYVSLGADSRDMVMVMSRVAEEGNSRLLAGMEQMLRLMLQQNADPNVTFTSGKEMRDGREVEYCRISERSMRDPYLFVELQCPSCGATGDYVSRHSGADGGSATCRKCGKKYELIRNVSEYEELLRATEERLRVSMQASFAEQSRSLDGTEARLRAAVEEQAGIIVSQIYEAEYRAVEASESRLLARMELMEERLATVPSRTEELERVVTLCMEASAEAFEKRLQGVVDRIDDAASEIRTRVGEMTELIRQILQKLLEGMPRPMPTATLTPSRPEEMECACCGKRRAATATDRGLQCDSCGLVQGEPFGEVYLAKENGRWRVTYSQKDPNGAPVSVYRLCLDDAMLNEMNASVVELRGITRGGIRTVVLTHRDPDETREVGKRLLEAVADRFLGLKRIVFGCGVKRGVCAMARPLDRYDAKTETLTN